MTDGLLDDFFFVHLVDDGLGLFDDFLFVLTVGGGS
jgi:hypothetical protein